MEESNFWNDTENANKIIKETNLIKREVENIEFLNKKIKNNLNMLELLTENDKELYELIETEYKDVQKELEKLKLETYLSGEYDHNNCILEIHAGAGGTESCDWANMLLRMYTRYCKDKGYTVEEIDKQLGEEVGIKSVMIKIIGKDAYGYLKGEKGVHRLVRISPFDSNKRRHTSFASVEVVPEIDKKIEVEINENDLKIDVYRSSGAGGQSVNTTDSAVRVTHLPSGIVVTCQNERSQIQNKEKAIEILKNKLYLLEIEKQNKELGLLKEGQMSIGFGSGKRSYVMCPYTLVKDNDTGYETSDVEGVLNGNIEEFIIEGIRRQV